MIQLNAISLYRGPLPLLRDASCTIHPGQKVGLVGANGSGKSSLFALIRGELHADAGDCKLPSDWVIANVAQETPALDCSALDFVLDGDTAFRELQADLRRAEAEHDADRIGNLHARMEEIGGYAAEARAGELLHGLGFDSAAQQQPVRRFSGGWRMRLNLAQALMCPSDLLLLDEPTNHLDLEAVIWLERWLKRYQGTLMLISHDRDFLDQVVGCIVHLEHQNLRSYTGGYSAFEEQRAAQLAQQQAMFEKQQQEIAHLERFIERFRAKASKAKAAQSRIKALERMEKIAPAHVDSPFHFSFAQPGRAPDPMIRYENVDIGYGETVVLRDINVSLRAGDRIGLLGRNGAGKSTLIKAFASALSPLAGIVHRPDGIKVGYFEQHQLEQLDMDASPLLHLRRIAPRQEEQKLRNFLGGFGFRGDDVERSVAPFSGGEKARLVLALLVWQAPNLLLLDEPTNHLDLDMRHALLSALQAYEGALVLVSHDRYLLGQCVDEFWLVDQGGLNLFDGDLQDYHQWLINDGVRQVSSAADEATAGGESRKARRKAAAEKRQAVQPLKKRIQQLEKDMESTRAPLAGLEARLADPELYNNGDPDELQQLLQKQGKLRGELEALEEAWLESQEALEQFHAELE